MYDKLFDILYTACLTEGKMGPYRGCTELPEHYESAKNLYYHMVPKGSNVSKGILSPYYLQMKHMDLTCLDKYRTRLTGGWEIYPTRDPKSLNVDEILDGLKAYRGQYGDRYIYLFKFPPYADLGQHMKRILSKKDIYEIDIDKIDDIVDIDYGYEGSYSKNKKLSKEYYDNISHDEYFSRYDDNNDTLLFAPLNHIGIATRSGYIPKKAIRKIYQV